MLALPPKLLPEAVLPHLEAFLREELLTSGLSCYVIGLSGGIDSALSAALAVRALGPDRVKAYYLPSHKSADQSYRDARKVAKFLGIRLMQIKVGDAIESTAAALKAKKEKTRLGNIAARLRMVFLFDQSQKHRGLVLGTSNKTELMMGYSTWYGDMACAVNPLGDLYKTQVWDLARDVGLPPAVIDKPPTADLWPGQTDEDEMGISYSQADRILYALLDLRFSQEELLGRGDMAQALIRKVVKSHKRNHFKRRMFVVCKIQQRTPGIDYRHARDLQR